MDERSERTRTECDGCRDLRAVVRRVVKAISGLDAVNAAAEARFHEDEGALVDHLQALVKVRRAYQVDLKGSEEDTVVHERQVGIVAGIQIALDTICKRAGVKVDDPAPPRTKTPPPTPATPPAQKLVKLHRPPMYRDGGKVSVGPVTESVLAPPGGPRKKLKRGARAMLNALVVYHPRVLPREHLATLCMMSESGGTFDDYVSALYNEGLVGKQGKSLVPTPEGIKLVGRPTPLPTRTELLEAWKAKLGKRGAKDMLEVLVTSPLGAPVTRADLARRASLTVSGGTFDDYVSMLNRKGLIVKHDDGTISASGAFFLQSLPP